MQCMSTGRSAVACNTCTSASDCFPQFHAPHAVSPACLHMTQAREGAIDGAIFGPEHALGRVGPGEGREEGFGIYGVCGRAARSHQEGLVCALHRLAISDHR